MKKIATLAAGMLAGLPVFAQPLAPMAYTTVSQAYDALRAGGGAKFTQQEDGWVVAVVEAGADEGIWSFAPRNNPAFPAVVKRKVLEKDGKLYIAMDAICQAKREPCDAMMTDFNKLNQEMVREMEKRRAK